MMKEYRMDRDDKIIFFWFALVVAWLLGVLMEKGMT